MKKIQQKREEAYLNSLDLNRDLYYLMNEDIPKYDINKVKNDVLNIL